MPRVKLELVAQRRELPTADGDRNVRACDTLQQSNAYIILFMYLVLYSVM